MDASLTRRQDNRSDASAENGRKEKGSQCGRFPKFHRVFWGRDPGTLKSDIVSKKHPQLICSDLETLNLKFRRLKLWKPTVAHPARVL